MKKKKLLSFLLTVAMMVSLFSVTAFASAGDADTTELPTVGEEAVKPVTCGEATYDTIKDAITAGETEITLSADLTEDVTIPLNTTVTIDLNGHNITSDSSHAIANHGVVTINGTGNINATQINCAAVANYPNAKAILNGGNYKADNWYTIKNLGTMTINAPVDISIGNPTNHQSLIDNGFYNAKGEIPDLMQKPDSSSKATLTINGGTFTAGSDNMQCIKNDDYGELTINDGTFTKTGTGSAVMNWNKATINNGTFTSADSVITNGGSNDSSDVGELTIKGGSFTAGEDGSKDLFNTGSGATAKKGKLSIQGGEFNGTLKEVSGEVSDQYQYDIEIEKGTFSNEVKEAYLADATDEASIKKNSGDATYYVGKADEITTTLESAVEEGDSIEVQKGDFTFAIEASDVTVENKGSGTVTVNDADLGSSGNKVTTEHVHQYAEGVYESDATGHWQECTLKTCKEAEKKTKTEAHTFKGVVSADGTTITYTCTVCGYEDTKPVAEAPAHTHDYTTAYNATSHWKTCTVDGCDAPVADKADHAFKEEVVVNPTKNSKGVKVLTCECGYQKIELIDQLKQIIKGTCQMPNPDGTGGFLMGLETYENPDNSYLYEMQIYDCTAEAWVYGTGLNSVPDTSFWTIWKPQYGYYWTLFRVYDANGVMLDEIVYGFENI